MIVEINKKLVTVILAIGSLTMTLVGFVAAEYLEVAKKGLEDLDTVKTEVVVMKQKMDDDKYQWSTLQRQDEKIKSLEVQIEVFKIMSKRSSEEKCNEIVVRVDGESFKNIPVVQPPLSMPQIPQIFIPPPVEVPVVKHEEKVFENLERKIEELNSQDNYEDYRRGQMIQQRAFPNQKDFNN